MRSWKLSTVSLQVVRIVLAVVSAIYIAAAVLNPDSTTAPVRVWYGLVGGVLGLTAAYLGRARAAYIAAMTEAGVGIAVGVVEHVVDGAVVVGVDDHALDPAVVVVVVRDGVDVPVRVVMQEVVVTLVVDHGVVAVAVTVAVTVIVCPATDGLTEETKLIEEDPLVTLCVSAALVLPLKLPSPL